MPDKEKVKAILHKLFTAFDQDNKGTVAVEDVGAILRYLGQFPPEGELAEVITKQLVDEAESKDIPYQLLEKTCSRLLADREYEPDFPDTLLEAFRAIDTEKLGYITVERASDVLTAGATGMREKELNEFLRYAKDKRDPEKIYYEEYIHNLTSFNTRHISKLWSNANN